MNIYIYTLLLKKVFFIDHSHSLSLSLTHTQWLTPLTSLQPPPQENTTAVAAAAPPPPPQEILVPKTEMKR